MIFTYIHISVILVLSNWLYKKFPSWATCIKQPNHAGFSILAIYSSFDLIKDELSRTAFFTRHLERYIFLALIFYVLIVMVNLFFSEKIQSKKQLIIPMIIPILAYIPAIIITLLFFNILAFLI